MRKRKIVRIQLFLLGVLALLLFYRAVEGPARPHGVVTFTDLDADRLHHAAFRLSEPGAMVIEATGSFEEDPSAGLLAAYGWILRRSDRRVVWRMDAANARQRRGSLAEAVDTVRLDEGVYDVYYTTYGNRQHGRWRGSFWHRLTQRVDAWRSDRRKWHMVVRPAEPGRSTATRLHTEAPTAAGPQGTHLIWSSAPMEGLRLAEHLIDVQRPARVRIYALGEIGDTRMDYGWIENVLTGQVVWEMRQDNTVPAGGWAVNRLFDGEIRLDPAIYRVVYKTDPRQSYRDWVGNPPFDPAAWGLSLFAVDNGEAVTTFDPWMHRRPVAQFTRVGNDARHTAQLDVRQSVRLLVYAVGEIGDRPYDYAWVRNEATGEPVWQMSREASGPAGGSKSNRVELAFLNLEPGVYTLGYESDGSHAFDSWAHGEPEHPERWGVTLFPVGTDLEPGAVEVTAQVHHSGRAEMRAGAGGEASATVGVPPPAPLPPPAAAVGTGFRMLRLTGLEADVDEATAFDLTEPSKLRITALGEISLSGRYDYGWIERAGSGDVVWEMTWQNTRPAGGHDRNRRFDGTIDLPPGHYVMRFRTDFSHHFGDFSDEAPDQPEAWGIVIEKL